MVGLAAILCHEGIAIGKTNIYSILGRLLIMSFQAIASSILKQKFFILQMTSHMFTLRIVNHVVFLMRNFINCANVMSPFLNVNYYVMLTQIVRAMLNTLLEKLVSMQLQIQHVRLVVTSIIKEILDPLMQTENVEERLADAILKTLQVDKSILLFS